jgi:hypothetical protein
MEKLIILDTSDQAAHYETNISGWVSRLDHYFGKDERAARYDGSTHKACECGKPAEKPWIKCSDCRKKADDERFRALAREEWDEETPLTLFDGDEYFFDRDQLEEWCDEHETTPQKLQLVICEPNYPSEIGDDLYSDDLPEDQYLKDVAPELAALIESVNTYIRENKPILSWRPSKIAAIIE